MKFHAEVEPPEPMRGLEVPSELVTALDAGARPRVKVTLGGHTWSTRIAILRGRHLVGLSHAHRTAAGVRIGDRVEVEIELDTSPVEAEEPADLTAALAADPAARAAYDRLSASRRRQQIRQIETAKKPETRARRIERAVTALHDTP